MIQYRKILELHFNDVSQRALLVPALEVRETQFQMLSNVLKS